MATTPAALARAIWAAGVAAVDPARLFSDLAPADLGPEGPTRLLVVGKAAGALARSAHERLGQHVVEGLVVEPAGGQPGGHPFNRIVAGHPIPTAESVEAGQAALDLARRSSLDGVPLLVLISGGASALLEVPADGLSLHDLQRTTEVLQASGASIGDLNTVRKHLSQTKGGRLAAAAYPALVHTLALSDVVGDDPGTIGSGPTVTDASNAADALHVIGTFSRRENLPSAVVEHLEKGNAEADRSKTGSHSTFRLLGSNVDALRGAEVFAQSLGFSVEVVTNTLSGEAREVAKQIAERLRAASSGVLLWAGETTVTVRGEGQGGRNQELALAAALELDRSESLDCALLSAGTDGIDGRTPAAGAVITAQTAGRLRESGLDPERALTDNDSYGLFERAARAGILPEGEGLVISGPTGTNVMDLLVGVVG